MPVVCVGNITVGGTGKTPHVEYIARLLADKMQVAVLSRGYKRTSRGFRVTDINDTVAQAGDEPLQMARHLPDVIVATDRDRVHGVTKLASLYPSLGAVILDDGFQHRSLKAGLNIILTSYHRLMTRDNLLPLGRLRDKVSEAARADIIIVSKTPEDLPGDKKEDIINELRLRPHQRLWFTSLVYDDIRPLFAGEEKKRLKKETGVVLVTGIADPLPVLNYITSLCSDVVHLRFPDHHNFSGNDIETITGALDSLKQNDKIIVTTEKDGVRLKEFTIIAVRFREQIYCLPVKVKFLDNEEGFTKEITGYAGKNH